MFSRPDRCSHPVVPLPPRIHLGAYVTGGLKDLYHRISRGEAFDNTDADVHTNAKGQFCPGHDRPVVMAQRYYITEVLSTRGQSAVLVYAEDLCDQNKLVVIKILHTSYFNIGAQEAECLRRLATADPLHVSHTVKLLNTFVYGGHYCMVFESLNPEPITEVFDSLQLPNCTHLEKIKKLTLQLLAVLGFLKQHNTIHADLKPENILLKHNTDLNSVQVIDFGNSIQHVHQEVSLYYQDFHVQTLLYRAPEVMFGIPFGTEIDMWSLGCILCELYLGKPLFFGRSKEEILSHITSILGPLPKEIFQRGKYSQELEKFTADIQQEDATLKLMQHLPGSRDYAFANFLAQLFRYDPDERLSPAEAAQHPFLAQELCISFLLPQATKKCQSSSILLNQSTYKKKVKISSEVKRQNPSTYDLLVLGTELKTDQTVTYSPGVSSFQETKVAEVQPYKQEADSCSPAHAHFELPAHLQHQSSRSSSPLSSQFEPCLNQRTPPFQPSSHSHNSNRKQHSVSKVYERMKSGRLLSPSKQRYGVPAFDMHRSSSMKLSPKDLIRSQSSVKEDPAPFSAQPVQIIKREEIRGNRQVKITERTNRDNRNASEARKDLNNAFHSPVKVLVSESPARSANQFVSRHGHSKSNHRQTVSPARGISSRSTYQPNYGHETENTKPETRTAGPRERFSFDEGGHSESSSSRVSRSPSGQGFQGTLVKSKSIHSSGKCTSPLQKPRISRFSVSPERTENFDLSKSKHPDRTESDVNLPNRIPTSSLQLLVSSDEALVHRSDLQRRGSVEHVSHSDLEHAVSPNVLKHETEWKVPLQVSSRRTKTDLNLKRRKLILEQTAIESVQDQTALLVSDMEDLSGDEARRIMLETTVQCEELEREKRSHICSVPDRTDVEQNKKLKKRSYEDMEVQDDYVGNKSHLIESENIKRSMNFEREDLGQKTVFIDKSQSFESNHITTQAKRKPCQGTKEVKDQKTYCSERKKASCQHKVLTPHLRDQAQDKQESSDDEAVEVMSNESVPIHNDGDCSSWYEKRFHSHPLQTSHYGEEREAQPPGASCLHLDANCNRSDDSMMNFTVHKHFSSKSRNSAIKSPLRAEKRDKTLKSTGILKQQVFQDSSESEGSSVEVFYLPQSYYENLNIHSTLKNKTLLQGKETNATQFNPSNKDELTYKHIEKKFTSEDNDIPLDECSSESDSEVNYIHDMDGTSHNERNCKVEPSQQNPEVFDDPRRPGVSHGRSRAGATQRPNAHHQRFTKSPNQCPASSQHDQEHDLEDYSPPHDSSSSRECSSPTGTTLPQGIPDQKVKPLEEKHEASEGESGPCVVSQGWRPESSVPSYEKPSTQQNKDELVLRGSPPLEDEISSLMDALSPSSDSSLLQLAEDSDDILSNKSDVFDISYCSHDGEDSDRESSVSKYGRGLHAKRKLKFVKKNQSTVLINKRSGLSESEKEQVRYTNRSNHDPFVFHSSPSMKSNKSFSTSMNLSSKKAKSSIYRLKNRKNHNKRSFLVTGRRKTPADRTTVSKRTKSAEELADQSSVKKTRRKATKSTITFRDLPTELEFEGDTDMIQIAGRKTLKEMCVKKNNIEREVTTNTEHTRRKSTKEPACSIRKNQTGRAERNLQTEVVEEENPATSNQQAQGLTFKDTSDQILGKDENVLQDSVEPAKRQMSKKHVHPNSNQHRRTRVTKKMALNKHQESVDANERLLSERTEVVLQDNLQQGGRKKRRKNEQMNTMKNLEATVEATSSLSKVPGDDNSDSGSQDSLESKVCFRKSMKHDREEFDRAPGVAYESHEESVEQSSQKSSSHTYINKTVKMLLESAKRLTPCITTASPRRTMNSSGLQRKAVDLNESVIFVTERGNRKGTKSNERRNNRTPAKSHKRKRTQDHDEDEIVLLIS